MVLGFLMRIIGGGTAPQRSSLTVLERSVVLLLRPTRWQPCHFLIRSVATWLRVCLHSNKRVHAGFDMVERFTVNQTLEFVTARDGQD